MAIETFDPAQMKQEYLWKPPESTDKNFDAIVTAIYEAWNRFIKHTCRITPYPYQCHVAYRILDDLINNKGNILTVLCARQSGKTSAVAMTAVFIATTFPMLSQIPQFRYKLAKFENGVLIGIFAPKQQQADITFERLKNYFNANMMRKLFNVGIKSRGGNTFTLTNGSVVKSLTASPDTTIEGETFHLAIIEEAQDVDDLKIQKSILPMLTATKGSCLMIGTPSFKLSYFYRQVQENKQKKEMHFEVNWRHAAYYNPDYCSYIANVAREIGRDSDAFRTQYELEWIIEKGMFTSIEEMNALADTQLTLYDRYTPPYGSHEIIIAGIDFAKSPDSTVVTILKYDYGTNFKTILNWLEIEHDDYETQIEDIINFIMKYSTKLLICDATGGSVGDPVVDFMRNRLAHTGIRIIGIQFKSLIIDQMYKLLQADFKDRRITYPYHESIRDDIRVRRFRKQFIELEKEYRNQYLRVKEPNTREGKKDYPTSLALAVLGAYKFSLTVSTYARVTSEKFDHIPGYKSPSAVVKGHTVEPDLSQFDIKWEG